MLYISRAWLKTQTKNKRIDSQSTKAWQTNQHFIENTIFKNKNRTNSKRRRIVSMKLRRLVTSETKNTVKS